MDRRSLLPLGLALAGLAAILVGLHQELVTVRPAYDGSITTGWGRDLNAGERQLGALATGALPVAAVTVRYPRARYLLQAVGLFVAGRALYASVHWLLQPDVYTGIPIAGGTSGELVLGAEPYLLVVGGLLLVAAGSAGARPAPLTRGDRDAQESAPAGR